MKVSVLGSGDCRQVPEANLFLANSNPNSFPLSPVQESLWFMDQVAPGSPAYNLLEGWRLKGRLRVAALERALQALANRHEVLRTAIRAREGKPVQVVYPVGSFGLDWADLTRVKDNEKQLQELMAVAASRPFDLTNPPLARVSLFRMAEEDHVMLVNMHHIISDAWSLGVFLRDTVELYNAEILGRAPDLAPLPIQYADFAAWQRDRVETILVEAQLGYWRKQLAGDIRALSFTTDHVRPPARSGRGAAQFTYLPSPLFESLKELSRTAGVTLFITLLAAFKTLLSRYTRQNDITVGSPLAGRNRIETEDLIGLFVNTHALRTNLDGDPAFLELLSRVRDTALGAAAHQDVSLERILSAVMPDRDLSRHPLFQFVFGWQGASSDCREGATNWADLEATRFDIENGTAKFDFTVLATETPRGVCLRSEYSTDLFLPQTVERFGRHFSALLHAISIDPRKRLSELQFLGPAERIQVLSAWNETERPYERDASIQDVFQQRAVEQPARLAVTCADAALSYGELEERANQFGRCLQRHGVRAGTPVAICMTRSLDMVVAMLGILKAGGAYVPIDPGYPSDRITFVLCDTGAPIVVADPDFDSKLVPPCTHTVIRTPLSVSSPGSPLTSSVAGQDLAYIMYTSGSTGSPKGAMITHRGVLRLVRNTNFLKFTPADTFLQASNISFDASTLEIWGPLLNGGKLVLLPPASLRVPRSPGRSASVALPVSLEELGRTIRREGVTTLWLTAGLFHQMVEHQLHNLGSLKYLLAGGDVLSVPHVLSALRGLPGCQIINGYGPTENTTFTCCFAVPPDWAGAPSVPIGKPVANTRVYVLDEHQHPVPVGVPGELYVAGDGLAQGYLNCPELTAARFVVKPVEGLRSDTVFYRTGDLVRRLSHGDLEFLGRLDLQVKIRGYRVEPGEIEQLLLQYPAVSDCCVIARGDSTDTKHLVAYVVFRSGPEVQVTEIRQYLETKLPAFMLPSHIVVLPRLPLTANGKVDRRALPAPSLQPEPERPPTRPVTPTEITLASIWQEVLGRNSFGTEDNFFHLGGHSLLATQVIARVGGRLQVEMPVRTIFEANTIRALAKAVDQAKADGVQPALEITPRQAVTTPPGTAGVNVDDVLRRVSAFLAQHGTAKRGTETLEGVLSCLEDLSDEEVEQLLQNPALRDFCS